MVEGIHSEHRRTPDNRIPRESKSGDNNMSYLEMLKKSQKHATHITAKSDKRSIGSFGSGVEGMFLEKYTHDEELSKVTKGYVDNIIRPHQHECPLIHGGHFPPECRFEPRLLAKTTKSGVLPDPDRVQTQIGANSIVSRAV